MRNVFLENPAAVDYTVIRRKEGLRPGPGGAKQAAISVSGRKADRDEETYFVRDGAAGASTKESPEGEQFGQNPKLRFIRRIRDENEAADGDSDV